MRMEKDKTGLMRCYQCNAVAYQDPEGKWCCPTPGCKAPEPPISLADKMVLAPPWTAAKLAVMVHTDLGMPECTIHLEPVSNDPARRATGGHTLLLSVPGAHVDAVLDGPDFTTLTRDYMRDMVLRPMCHYLRQKIASLPRDVVTEITSKRGPIYGPFLHNGIVAQNIKDAMRNIPDPDNEGSQWATLAPDIREALDLIALKMSRILTGDSEYLDNWDDIGGYAKIVADRLRATNNPTTEKGK